MEKRSGKPVTYEQLINLCGTDVMLAVKVKADGVAVRTTIEGKLHRPVANLAGMAGFYVVSDKDPTWNVTFTCGPGTWLCGYGFITVQGGSESF